MPRGQKALPLARLGQLFKFVDGKTPSREVTRYWDGEIPFACSSDLTDRELAHTRDSVTAKAVKAGVPLVKPGSILIAVRGQSGSISVTRDRVAIGDDIKALERKSYQVSVRYVYWLLVYRQRESRGKPEQSPSRSPDLFFGRIKTVDLQKLVFPLPELREQTRIAEILDDADDARRARAKANGEIIKLLPALFAKMFEEKEYKWLRLDQCADVISGITPSRSTEEYWRGEIPWISSGDITSPFHIDAKKHITKEALDKTGLEPVPPRSIVIGSASATFPYHLQIALTEKECTIGQDVKALVCRPRVSPEYLICSLVQSESELLRQSSGLPWKRLDVRALNNFSLPVPPLGRQKEWAEVMADVREMTRRGNESLNELELLFDTLARRQFGRDLLRGRAPRVRQKKRRMPTKAAAARALENKLSDERPIIWSKLSDGQRRIWVLSQTFDKPFSVDEFIAVFEKSRKSRLSREYVLGTLDLLVTLGTIIREGRIDDDRWRRPRPETDREVQI